MSENEINKLFYTGKAFPFDTPENRLLFAQQIEKTETPIAYYNQKEHVMCLYDEQKEYAKNNYFPIYIIDNKIYFIETDILFNITFIKQDLIIVLTDIWINKRFLSFPLWFLDFIFDFKEIKIPYIDKNKVEYDGRFQTEELDGTFMIKRKQIS